MPDVITPRTRVLSRQQLAKFLPSQEAVRAFERALGDLQTQVPDVVNQHAADIAELQINAQSIEATALAAQSVALLAQSLAEHAMLASELAELRARVDVLTRTVSDLQEAPK